MTTNNQRTTYNQIQTLANRLGSIVESNKDSFFAKKQQRDSANKGVLEVERRRKINEGSNY